jgi:hypothetical protein
MVAQVQGYVWMRRRQLAVAGEGGGSWRRRGKAAAAGGLSLDELC